MGTWLLLVALFTGDGNSFLEGRAFESKAQCEAALVRVPEIIRGANEKYATKKDDTIVQYGASCVQAIAAPKGKFI